MWIKSGRNLTHIDVVWARFRDKAGQRVTWGSAPELDAASERVTWLEVIQIRTRYPARGYSDLVEGHWETKARYQARQVEGYLGICEVGC